jgi:hypothetical protein
MGNIYDNQGEINRIWYRKCVVKNKELKNWITQAVLW